MKSYLQLAPKYLAHHKSKTRFTLISVIISVALVVAIFSIMDSIIKFEKNAAIKNIGNYHIFIKNTSENEISFIKGRIEVKNSGFLKDFGKGTINGDECQVYSLEKKFSDNFMINLSEGRYPEAENEIMLEKWAMEKFKPSLKIGDTVKLKLTNDLVKDFVISGVYKDQDSSKVTDTPIVFVSAEVYKEQKPVMYNYYILFKDGVNIINAEEMIKTALKIPEDRIGRNEQLLALIGQSKNNQALKIYMLGAVLAFLVLITAAVMIFNTFNISVMERIRQFGLLRCVGASKVQIRKLVWREGLYITLRGVPIGIVIGMCAQAVCSAILKFYNKNIYADIPFYSFSIIGIVAGIIVGFLTVFLALILPARKASRVSPVNAVTGSGDIKISKGNKKGIISKIFKIEIAMGISNVFCKKKTLILMTSSIALSIIMFLAFSTLLNPSVLGIKPVKPYTPDIALMADGGIDKNIYEEIAKTRGIKKIYGRIENYNSVSFLSSKLTDAYKKTVGEVKETDNGLFVPPENSWLISYDKIQREWAKDYLTKGELDENKLNEKNGVIAVENKFKKDAFIKTNNLQLGDKIYISTDKGVKEFTVMGIVDQLYYESEKTTLATFILTEKQLTEIKGSGDYNSLDIQLNKNGQEETIKEIKGIIDSKISFHDIRQANSTTEHAFMTVAVFVYGFVFIIALISLLNIVNTMNTSITSKTKYYGVIRAVGMSQNQLSKMIYMEAFVYTFSGCLFGSILGILLQRKLVALLRINWRFPLLQIMFVFFFCLISAFLAIVRPMKKLKSSSITEMISR